MATQRQIARREAILERLRKWPEGGTARALSEVLGIHYTTANDDLSVLLSQGKVTVSGGPAERRPREWKAL